MRKRNTMRIALVGLISAAALVLAACGGGSSNTAAPTSAATQAPPTQSLAEAPTAATVAVSVGDTDTSHMFMRLDKASVAPGPVTFTVTNDGVKKHEFVVIATDLMGNKLPYVKADDEITEEGPGVESPGEIGELKPGETKSVTIDLAAGHYVLVCNIKGHWRMGMYADFQVT